MGINIYLYVGLVVLFTFSALWSFRIGNVNIDTPIMRISVLLFLLFTVYIYFNSVNAIDSSNYQTRFEYADSLSVSGDFLFVYFIRVVRFFTLDYQIFRAVIGCFFLVPVLLILVREKEMNKPLFLLLCLLFPFFQSIVALRFTLSSAIASIALYLYLKSNQTRTGKIITMAALLLASLIHDTCILYFILLVAFLIFKKISNGFYMMVSLLLIDIFLIIGLRIGILSDLVNTLVGESNTFYLGIMETAGIGFLISIFLHLAFVFLLLRTVEKENEDGVWSELERDVLLLNYCSVIFIPIYAVNVLSFRLFRGLLIFDFLVFCKYYWNRKKDIALFSLIGLEVTCMLFDASGIESFISIIGGGITQKEKNRLIIKQEEKETFLPTLVDSIVSGRVKYVFK